jgi:hypothetical protein
MEIIQKVFEKYRGETPPEAMRVRPVRKLAPGPTGKFTGGISLISTSPQEQGHIPARDVWCAWKLMYYS